MLPEVLRPPAAVQSVAIQLTGTELAPFVGLF